MNRTDIKAFFFSIVLDLILCAVLCTSLACAGSYPIKNAGAASVLFYNEPQPEQTALNEKESFRGEWKEAAVTYKQAKQLRRYVNSIDRWNDDAVIDRKAYVFAGEFRFLNNEGTYYFTERGTVYFRRDVSWYSGQLSEKGAEFLLSLRPAE